MTGGKVTWVISQIPPSEDILTKELQKTREASKLEFSLANTLKNLREVSVLDSLLDEIKYLEVGTGFGSLIYYLSECGNGQYFGIEPDKIRYNFIKNKIKKGFVSNILLEDASFEKKFFDYVVASEVVEHLKDPSLLLRKSNEWLKVNGKIFIDCPNVDNPFARKNIYTWRNAIPSHRWLFSVKSLSSLLQQNNFEVEKVITYGGFPTPRNIFTGVGNKLLKLFGQGDMMIVLARKKGDI